MPVFPIFRRLRLAVIIPRRVRQGRIVLPNRDCRPLACRPFVIDALQSTATIERPITNRSHIVRDNHARQAAAITERPITD